MIQVPPEDTISNSAKWIKFFGFSPPVWLDTKNSDLIGHWLFIALIVIGVVWVLWPIVIICYKKLRGISSPDRPRWHLMDGLIASAGTESCCIVELNNGNKTLRDCRIKMDNQLIHKPFDLLPGDKKHIPIIKFPGAISDTMAIVYSYVQVDGKWQMSDEISRVIIGGAYHLKLVAEDLYPPLKMTVNILTHDTVATEWGITEARKCYVTR